MRIEEYKRLCIDQAKETYLPEFFKEMSEDEKITKGAGILLAYLFKWCGEPIMDAAAYALEDANFHLEAAINREMKKGRKVFKILASTEKLHKNYLGENEAIISDIMAVSVPYYKTTKLLKED